MKRLAASLVLVAFSATWALAQNTPQPANPAPQADAPQTADANAPSESHIAAAIDLLKANHTNATTQAILDIVLPVAIQQAKRTTPNLSDADAAKIAQLFRDTITAHQDELLRIEAIEYTHHFSEQELRGLAAFYNSELGQKYVNAIPTLLKEINPIVQRWMIGVVQQVLQDILHSQPPAQNGKS